MTLRKRVEELDLVGVLLVVAGLELLLNRLAVPVLRPPGHDAPPGWHRELDRVGLYVFYLASLLAIGVGAVKTWELTRSRWLFPGFIRLLIAATGTLFFALAAWGIFLPVTPGLSFYLESIFTLFLLTLATSVAARPGDLRVKAGFVILTVPFLLHSYGTFALRLLMNGAMARGSSLPDHIRDVGQWSVAIAAIGVAACFAPRPVWRTGLRPGPLIMAAFVGTIVAVIMVRHQDVGMEIASKGLGIEIVPGSPTPVVAAFVLAAAAVAWTLTATLTSAGPGRRLLGTGYGLVVVGGYAFAWPLQLLTVAAGALAIAEAAGRIPDDPREAEAGGDLPATPRIPDPTWQAYAEALRQALRAETLEIGNEVTRLSGKVGELAFAVAVTRRPASVESVEITFLSDPPDEEPAWVMVARAEGIPGALAHPPPPRTAAPAVRVGDEAFDQRFRVHDRSGGAQPTLTARLLDEGLRARATAVIDGWVAVWPGRSLRYRVCPGRGAPLDHPVPITELAFRSGDASGATDRLVRVFELLRELAVRAR
jgi:hypothetical protein